MATLARWQSTIVDNFGNIMPGAQVTVRKEIAGAPLAALYTDRAGTVPLGNPFTVGSDALAAFHAIGGPYRITATLGGLSQDYRYVAVGRAAEADQVLFGVPYIFDDAVTDLDPGDGQIRFNSATYASVTTIFVDLLNALAADMTTYIGTWDDSGSALDRGVIIIQSRDGTNYWMGTITGSVTTATGYRKIAVTYLGHAGTFLVDEAIGVVVIRRGVDGAVSGPGVSVNGDIATWNGTGGNTLADSGVTILTVGAGKQTVWVPAGAMYKQSAAAGPSTGQLVVSSSVINYLAFDPGSAEDAHVSIPMPKSWNVGTVTAKFIWAHPSTTVNFGVVWSLFTIAYGDNDAINGSSFSTVISVTDTGGVTSNSYISPETAAITIGNTPAALDWVDYLIRRTAADVADTLAVDAYLIGVLLFYTTNANTDA